MTLSQYRIKAAGTSPTAHRAFAAYGQRTAFLCHSHKDRALALGLQELLRLNGLDLYIDWQDAEMPEQPSSETAARLRVRIKQSDFFLFLATQNSMNSRWCPWELGNADGVKPNERILLVPTSDGLNTHGSEYLNLYRRVDASTAGDLQVIQPGYTYGTSVRSL